MHIFQSVIIAYKKKKTPMIHFFVCTLKRVLAKGQQKHVPKKNPTCHQTL